MDEMECARIYGRRARELTDENERLKNRIAELEEALRGLWKCEQEQWMTNEAMEKARKALEGK